MWPDPDHCFQIPTDYVDQELTEKIEDTCPLWSVTAHGTKLSLEDLETSLQHEELIWCRPNLSLVSLLADAKRNRPVEASQMSFQVKILERLVSVSELPSSIAKRIEMGGINIILTYILAYAKQKNSPVLLTSVYRWRCRFPSPSVWDGGRCRPSTAQLRGSLIMGFGTQGPVSWDKIKACLLLRQKAVLG